MNIFLKLYSKLALAMLALFILFGAVVIYINSEVSSLYSLEMKQRMNQDVALYAAESMPLFEGNEVNEKALKELAFHVMFINPIVEIYLLDTDGTVLSHALPSGTHTLEKVDMTPLHALMNGQQALPILGDDPRNPDKQKVFSVSPVKEDGKLKAYLYTILNGQAHDSLKESIEGSHNIQAGVFTILGSMVLAVIAGLIIFSLLTKRLQNLMQAVRNYRDNSFKGNRPVFKSEPVRDEIDELSCAIGDMAERIDSQFNALQTVDKTRRELIANVSHDLRTPISSMQGYLETIMVKGKQLSEEDKVECIATAYKSSRRLNRLIGELFELAKLESANTVPTLETFPLMELVQDIIQDCSLQAQQLNITITVQCKEMESQVNADIALIHRVLDNLIQNALRHTDEGGEVIIKVHSDDNNVRIEVADNGHGIASHEIPKLFERYYQRDPDNSNGGSGLGLAIVKRIIDLHKTKVTVESELDQGTVFTFWLPQPTVA